MSPYILSCQLIGTFQVSVFLILALTLSNFSYSKNGLAAKVKIGFCKWVIRDHLLLLTVKNIAAVLIRVEQLVGYRQFLQAFCTNIAKFHPTGANHGSQEIVVVGRLQPLAGGAAEGGAPFGMVLAPGCEGFLTDLHLRFPCLSTPLLSGRKVRPQSDHRRQGEGFPVRC